MIPVSICKNDTKPGVLFFTILSENLLKNNAFSLAKRCSVPPTSRYAAEVSNMIPFLGSTRPSLTYQLFQSFLIDQDQTGQQ